MALWILDKDELFFLEIFKRLSSCGMHFPQIFADKCSGDEEG
jgi:hypothetical protein